MIGEWMSSSLLEYYSNFVLSQVGGKPSLVSLLAGAVNIFFAHWAVFRCISRLKSSEDGLSLMYGALVMLVLMLIIMVLKRFLNTQRRASSGLRLVSSSSSCFH